MKTTVLIQGPIGDPSFVEKSYKHYTNQGYNVHLHTWSDDKLSTLNIPYTFSVQGNPEDQVLVDHPTHGAIASSAYYHIKNVTEGLKQFNSDYVIKVRTDEFFSNLNPIFNELENAPNKVVTTNVYLRDQTTTPFNISDHLIASRYTTMYDAFSTLLEFFESYLFFSQNNKIFHEEAYRAVFGRKYVGPQILLGKAFLHSLGFRTLNVKDMYSSFTVVPVSKLGQYVIKSNHQVHHFDSTINPFPEDDPTYTVNKICEI